MGSRHNAMMTMCVMRFQYNAIAEDRETGSCTSLELTSVSANTEGRCSVFAGSRSFPVFSHFATPVATGAVHTYLLRFIPCSGQQGTLVALDTRSCGIARSHEAPFLCRAVHFIRRSRIDRRAAHVFNAAIFATHPRDNGATQASAEKCKFRKIY